MSYCETGDKPVIFYKFGNGNEKRYQFDFAPIDIITRNQPIGTTSNFNGDGYQISFFSPNNGINLSFIVKDYYLNYASTYNGHPALMFLGCESTGFTAGPNVDVSSITKNYTIKCLTPDVGANEYLIEISYNNLQIFQDKGDAPVTFDVQCGKCPQGFCEYKIPKYPGYCCLDCAYTAASIRFITNVLRSKNS